MQYSLGRLLTTRSAFASLLCTLKLRQIEVSRQGKTWIIFRRFSQFDELDKKLRSRKLIRSDIRLPEKTGMKRATDAAFIQSRISAMEGYLNTVLAILDVRNSEPIHNFLGPFQLKDVRNNYYDGEAVNYMS